MELDSLLWVYGVLEDYFWFKLYKYFDELIEPFNIDEKTIDFHEFFRNINKSDKGTLKESAKEIYDSKDPNKGLKPLVNNLSNPDNSKERVAVLLYTCLQYARLLTRDGRDKKVKQLINDIKYQFFKAMVKTVARNTNETAGITMLLAITSGLAKTKSTFV